MRLPQRVRAQAAAARQTELRRKEVERARKAVEKAQKAQEREAKRQYQEAREAEATASTEALDTELETLSSLLAQTLTVDDAIDFDDLRDHSPVPEFDAQGLDIPGPPPSRENPAFQPPPEPTGIQRLIPGWRKKYEPLVAAAKAEHEAAKAKAAKDHALALERYGERERRRQEELEARADAYEASIIQLDQERTAQHATIDQFEAEFGAGDPEAMTRYFSLVLERSPYPPAMQLSYRLAYVPESHQLVVEKELPGFEVIPDAREYRYMKAKDAIVAAPRPITERRKIYASVVGQIVLRTIHELFEADTPQHLETIVINGFVDTVDPRTGQGVRPCLVSLRTGRDQFARLDLARVDPLACLKALNAGVSKSPAELVPIRPVLDFNMVDPRFVEETDVLSSLEARPNLMELSPSEFESLITNLFEKMGLETRLTQASRDGGVDCVAYDPRPIFGGKVVIQAKRYKNTVGVSAVRDLFGTMQNEGASKGILVTTSGYGTASFEFAEGKPLELLSGSNLLYLLKEHVELEARIEVPEDWVDPAPDLD
jgi:restriction system protein